MVCKNKNVTHYGKYFEHTPTENAKNKISNFFSSFIANISFKVRHIDMPQKSKHLQIVLRAVWLVDPRSLFTKKRRLIGVVIPIINLWRSSERLRFMIVIPIHIPADTLRNNDVVITSKRRHFDVITSK